MLPLLAAVILGAAPAQAPLRLAVPGLQGVNISAEELSFYSEHLAQNLRAPGLTVATAREIAALLGLERQKSLLGCSSDAAACVAELANALGVDAVVLGDIARFDDTFQINAKIVAASDASVITQGSRRVRGQVETLEGMAALGRELSRALFEKKGRAVPVELLATPAREAGARRLAWLPLAGGAAVGGAGAVLLALANADAAALRGSGASLDEVTARGLRDGGATKQTAGAICVAVGATAVAAGVAMIIFGREDAPGVSLAPIPGGAAFAISGVLP